MDYSNFLNGYKDRVMRITLFDMFNTIENKQRKDDNDKPIDFFGIGLLSLMFFFENMLTRNTKTGVNELAVFLKEILEDKITLSNDGYRDIAKSVIEVMRPPSGKRNRKEFFNYETGEPDFVEYSILKADSWDRQNNLQYYVLDEQGLELIFATKEYFSEFQISISQLVLRKQLEKGEFLGALRQIEEMRINVNAIKEKIHHIKHEIQRNIISDETYERYKDLITDINIRLNYEHEEFEELAKFIRDTKIHLDSGDSHTEKEQKALEYIVRVDNELFKVHSMHSNLLRESIELKSTAIDSATESLYFVGLKSFNFDQEITGKLMTKPLPFESSRLFVNPFLKTSKFQTWSLLTVFEGQMVESGNDKIKHHEYVSVDDNEEVSLDRKQQQAIYKYIFERIVNLMGDRKEVTIDELLSNTENEFLGTREFNDFFIVLHQLSPINLNEIMSSKEHVFAKAFETISQKNKVIKAIELEDEITFDESYYIKNMKLIIGEETDD
jgi:hypothetical protein